MIKINLFLNHQGTGHFISKGTVFFLVYKPTDRRKIDAGGDNVLRKKFNNPELPDEGAFTRKNNNPFKTNEENSSISQSKDEVEENDEATCSKCPNADV